MYSFDFLKMQPDKGLVVSGLSPSNTYHRAISEPGRQYALYIHHSSDRRASYTVAAGSYHEILSLRLQPGRYQADWVDPARGSVISSETFTHQDGDKTLTAPAYTVDIALRIKRH
jgi:hypothetical protein